MLYNYKDKRDEIMKMHKQLFSLKDDSDEYKNDIDILSDTFRRQKIIMESWKYLLNTLMYKARNQKFCMIL